MTEALCILLGIVIGVAVTGAWRDASEADRLERLRGDRSYPWEG